MTRKLKPKVARAFLPLLPPSRYKGAKGGRGSGKSHFFAERLVARCIEKPGLRVVCIREVQKSLKESAKKLIEDKIISLGVADQFGILTDQIKTPGGGIIIFQGMQDHTAESIKSLEGFDIAWCEEAQTLSKQSLKMLRPTIRAEGSELWFSWNPRKKDDPVDSMFMEGQSPTGAILVTVNYDDNPWFPSELEQERQDCLRDDPDQYDNIWCGGYISIVDGAYYAKSLAKARSDGRIGVVPIDPLMTIKLFCDIGGTGAKSDAFAIWAAQFIGLEVRVLNYYEAQGQPIDSHLSWMRSQGYTPDTSEVWLPHDGSTHDRVYSVSYESAFEDAGYNVEVVPNQGKGAASARIEAGRRLFPSIWFNEDTTLKGGIAALGWYHEKKDDVRGIGLGPDHDWSSHGADAFGLMCVAHKPPTDNTIKAERLRHQSPGQWMG